jgi:hypothetical protein
MVKARRTAASVNAPLAASTVRSDGEARSVLAGCSPVGTRVVDDGPREGGEGELPGC